MPFQSKAQAKFLYAKNPEVAREFASKTESLKDLPEHKKKKRGSGDVLRESAKK